MLAKGEIYQAIDDNGERRGFAIFLDRIEPWSPQSAVTDAPGFWHYKVLQDGEIRYLNTSKWTLIPFYVPNEA